MDYMIRDNKRKPRLQLPFFYFILHYIKLLNTMNYVVLDISNRKYITIIYSDDAKT